MIRREVLWLLAAGALLLEDPAQAQSLQASIDRGFDHFYNLEFGKALEIFDGLVSRDPDVATLRNHVAQTILFREMLRAGALETELVTGGNAFLRREKMNPSAEDRRRFAEAVDAALRLSGAALAKNPRDPDALYARGVAYGLRANYNFLVNKAWMDALRDATEARKAHQALLAIDPKRKEARLIPATHEYVVAALPWHYRILGFLTGFHGNKTEGIRALEALAREPNPSRADAMILLATVYRRERDFSKGVELLETLVPMYPRNYLFRLELAQMYSDLGNGDAALKAVAGVEALKHAGTPGYEELPDEKILYFRATIQFWYRDFDRAIDGFQRVTAKAKELDPNTGVTAWMRLGQLYDMKGRRNEAEKAYRSAMAYAPDSGVARECAGYLKQRYVMPPPA